MLHINLYIYNSVWKVTKSLLQDEGTSFYSKRLFLHQTRRDVSDKINAYSIVYYGQCKHKLVGVADLVFVANCQCSAKEMNLIGFSDSRSKRSTLGTHCQTCHKAHHFEYWKKYLKFQSVYLWCLIRHCYAVRLCLFAKIEK